jgi:hypothetical protein
MQLQNFFSFEITEVVSDRMYVLIKCPILKNKPLTYKITNTNNYAVRKGGFLGESVQLNLVHVPDGEYYFTISNEEGKEFSLPFQKTSGQYQGNLLKVN